MIRIMDIPMSISIVLIGFPCQSCIVLVRCVVKDRAPCPPITSCHPPSLTCWTPLEILTAPLIIGVDDNGVRNHIDEILCNSRGCLFEWAIDLGFASTLPRRIESLSRISGSSLVVIGRCSKVRVGSSTHLSAAPPMMAPILKTIMG